MQLLHHKVIFWRVSLYARTHIHIYTQVQFARFRKPRILHPYRNLISTIYLQCTDLYTHLTALEEGSRVHLIPTLPPDAIRGQASQMGGRWGMGEWEKRKERKCEKKIVFSFKGSYYFQVAGLENLFFCLLIAFTFPVDEKKKCMSIQSFSDISRISCCWSWK